MIGTKKKNVIVLDRVSYIYYLVQFRKRGKKITRVLINSNIEVNSMTPTYAN